MGKSKGMQLSLYLDSDLSDQLLKSSAEFELTPQEFIRHLIKKECKENLMEEIERQQIFSLRLAQFFANKISHLEVISQILRDSEEGKQRISNYEEVLTLVKENNLRFLQNIAEESL